MPRFYLSKICTFLKTHKCTWPIKMENFFFLYKQAKINLQNSYNILTWKFWRKKWNRVSWFIVHVLPLRLSCISSHCVSTWPGHLLRPSQPIHPHLHSTKLSALDDHSQPQMFLLPYNSKQNQDDKQRKANLHVWVFL